MKHFLILALILFSSVAKLSSQTTLVWQKCYGGSSGEYANDIIQLADGGFLITGYTESNNGDISGNHGSEDYMLIRTNAAGTILWQKCYGGTEDEESEGVAGIPGGGFILAGNTRSSDGDVTSLHSQYSPDAWIVKVDDSGTVIWQKCIGGTSDDYADDVALSSDGSIYAAGRTYSDDGDITVNKGNCDVMLIKLDANGNKIWVKTYGGSEFDEAMALYATSDGGAILCGRTGSTDQDVSGNHGNDDSWVVKVNSSGTIEWQKCLGGTEDEEANDIIQTSDGGYALLGYTDSNNGDITSIHSTENDFWFVKLNSAGVLQWQKCYGGTADDQAETLCETADGGFLLSGLVTSNDGDVSGTHGTFFPIDIWVVKINSTGTLLWQRACGGTDQDEAHQVMELNDGSAVVCGYTYSVNGDVTGNHGNKDAWVIRVSGPAQDVPQDELIPIQVFPIPASGEINVCIRETARYSFVSPEGKIVLEGLLEPGTSRIETPTQIRGIWLLKITTATGTAVRKIVLY